MLTINACVDVGLAGVAQALAGAWRQQRCSQFMNCLDQGQLVSWCSSLLSPWGCW